MQLSVGVHLSQPAQPMSWFGLENSFSSSQGVSRGKPKTQTFCSVCCIFFTLILLAHFHKKESSWLPQASSTPSNDPSRAKREHKTLTCVVGGEDKRQNL